MKTIILKELTLRNFKGIRNKTITFSSQTDIHGRNGSGKTSVADAFYWLLYGKNSEDQKDFGIKTLEDGKVIPKIEHEVTGTFDVDGQNIVFKRVFTEKWVTKRGSAEESFTGHKTDYFVDDIPKSKNEYDALVSDMLDDKIQRMISSPYYFNTKINWKDRRKILMDMAGEINNQDIFNSLSGDNAELKELIEAGKNLEDEKKRLNTKRLTVKKEFDVLPSRIDEVQRSIPEQQDWAKIESDISKVETMINDVQDKIDDSNKAYESEKKKASDIRISKFEKEEKLKRLAIQNKSSQVDDNKVFKGKIEELQKKHRNTSYHKDQNDVSIKGLKEDNEMLSHQNNLLKTDWHTENDKKFELNPDSLKCPTCKQDLPDIEAEGDSLRSRFNTNKLKALSDIEAKGQANKKTIEQNKEKIAELTAENNKYEADLTSFKAQIKQLESQLSDKPKEDPEPTKEMMDLQKEIDAIVIPEVKMPDVEELKKEKYNLEEQSKELVRQLFGKDQIDQKNKRIEELKQEQRKMSQEIADCERVVMQIDQFNKAKINVVESRINDKFASVTFNMFEEQINGGETESCECLLDGVPYNDLNTASKINAGLDIVNALQYHYGILCPIFIDGRESVTTIIPMDCQVISLTVDPSSDELQILNL